MKDLELLTLGNVIDPKEVKALSSLFPCGFAVLNFDFAVRLIGTIGRREDHQRESRSRVPFDRIAWALISRVNAETAAVAVHEAFAKTVDVKAIASDKGRIADLVADLRTVSKSSVNGAVTVQASIRKV
jgi:hypothetical protein